jgi:trehalose 2-sulfotransferase
VAPASGSPTRIGGYLICATPRTGSTLLCSALASTGLAGKPESYFRSADVHAYAARWGVPVGPDGSLSMSDFVRAARTAGSTPNGVFGARVMWGTIEDVVGPLRAHDDGSRGSDLAVLERVLGPTCCVYLRRSDVVAQAVSWARAEQTGRWQDGDPVPGFVPRFDPSTIDGYATTIRRHDAAWHAWFEAQGVRPLVVCYEDLVDDAAGIVGSTLEWLGLDPAAGHRCEVGTQRQSDALNEEWIERYHAWRQAGRPGSDAVSTPSVLPCHGESRHGEPRRGEPR